ncbi:MAG: Rpn family recombination-promoting nuclease/putative transposase [Oscillospiraceae bacterium]|jgi:predicted transposase/invertase (TIGR01784 family)|nr:Rpn family recombination-promoting nuclease/putative transposase [Oscillospiraceae bacterium]
MTMLEVKLTNDEAFKRLFVEDTDVLTLFLSTVLDIPRDEFSDLVIDNPEVLPKVNDDKLCRLDIHVSAAGRLIDIEMQLGDKSYFRERSLYYWSDMFVKSLHSGQKYSELKQTIAINVLGYNTFDSGEFHSVFRLHENKTGELLTDRLAIHFIELKKVPEPTETINLLEAFARLLSATTYEELDEIEALEVTELSKAVSHLRVMNADDILKERIRLQEKAAHDYASDLGEARNEGKTEGLVEGRIEGRIEGKAESKIEMVKLMYRNGATIDQISKLVELPLSEVVGILDL